ncbi:nitrilase [Iodidimonas muriae]|uniref:Nitrilase n=1 Tax=Iodidimonas muriae TaxID=261467 RepID=A0ABQ2LF41_9PROT|nr:carbon-nitrogen hydrolase family protein [Iodidimonas muriae]GER07230.1 nitrilase [Kordiimonadales bacterium JCM 17843]GGO11419.1 nitrilase [Iodidimonas muriae]
MTQATSSSPVQPCLAIIQRAPVFLNLPASVDLAISEIEAAAKEGATIIAFAECWLPGYPVWLDEAPKAALWNQEGAKQLYQLLSQNAVVLGDAYLSRLADAARRTGCYILIGSHERRGGTLYNTSFSFAPDGTYIYHRKLVPTYTERLIWGRGDGSTLKTQETPWGVLGSLICWEHWMPLARAAMHAQTEAIHIAQWPTVNDMHQVASRAYAFEGRCFVAAAGCILSKDHVLDGFASLKPDMPQALDILGSMPPEGSDLIQRGGSALIAPDGRYSVSPVYDREIRLMAPLDLGHLARERQALDSAGHYSRPDIFELSVNTKPQMGVVFKDDETD